MFPRFVITTIIFTVPLLKKNLTSSKENLDNEGWLWSTITTHAKEALIK